MPVSVEDQVFGLEVTVNDVVLVQVFNGQDDLRKVEPGLIFLEVDLILQHSSQVASWQVLENKDMGLAFGKGKRRSG